MLVNLNKHAIDVQLASGEAISLPPSGTVATVSVVTEDAGSEAGVPCVYTTYGPVVGLPEPEAGVTYVVNAIVLARVRGRDDVVAPDTGPSAVRFADGPQKGQVKAVVRFVRADCRPDIDF